MSGPSSLPQQAPRSLLDATPTEEQSLTPLVPLNMSPRASPVHRRSPDPATVPDGQPRYRYTIDNGIPFDILTIFVSEVENTL